MEAEGEEESPASEPPGRRVEEPGKPHRAGVARRAKGAAPAAGPSSSSEEEAAAGQAVQRIRRRRRRKRPVGEQERQARQKAAAIEEALRAGDRDRLAQLAASKGGLLSDQVRARVWPQLLGIRVVEAAGGLPGEEEVAAHPSYAQVVLDVNRSLKRFPPGIEEAARPGLQDQLTRLIVRVLIARPLLHYYQGYHDVAITFLLVVGEELAFRIMERLSESHLKQFMAPTMEETMGLLELMYPLVQHKQPALHKHLVSAELGTIFALPWLITWFGHVLPDYGDVVRLYDFFLAGPPLMPVYLAAAIVLHRREELLAVECEMSALHGLLARIPLDLPFEELLASCLLLYEALPPHLVEEAARRSREERELRWRRAVPSSSSSPWPGRLVSIVIYAAPVLIGMLLWRAYGTV